MTVLSLKTGFKLRIDIIKKNLKNVIQGKKLKWRVENKRTGIVRKDQKNFKIKF